MVTTVTMLLTVKRRHNQHEEYTHATLSTSTKMITFGIMYCCIMFLLSEAAVLHGGGDDVPYPDILPPVW
eukprot:9529362-Ditylum_brightwellii.AAC.1